jgi:L-threonylcarbamoyladenylate synthase
MKTEILAFTPENIALLSKELQNGKLVAIPTETVYGLAGNALNSNTVARIFEAKERPTFDPLIVHLPSSLLDSSVKEPLEVIRHFDLVRLDTFSQSALEILKLLLQTFWPGPLTVVLPKTSKVPDLVTSGLESVALRMPQHPVAQALLLETQLPLAAPSANRFGRISPTAASDVEEELRGRISWILDGGRCTIGLESTVLSLSPQTGELCILRPGAITETELSVSFPGLTLRSSKPPVQGNLTSPGLLDSHYAPRKKLLLLPSAYERSDSQKALKKFIQTENLKNVRLGLLLFSEKKTKGFHAVKTLSSTGDLKEAAFQFFSLLRELDASDAEILFAEPCPFQDGLGHALTDRLKRASHPLPL